MVKKVQRVLPGGTAQTQQSIQEMVQLSSMVTLSCIICFAIVGQEEQIKVNVCDTVVKNTKVDTSDAKEEEIAPPPKCEFDITETLPGAFQNASPQLLKSEQSNLYYR